MKRLRRDRKKSLKKSLALTLLATSIGGVQASSLNPDYSTLSARVPAKVGKHKSPETSDDEGMVELDLGTDFLFDFSASGAAPQSRARSDDEEEVSIDFSSDFFAFDMLSPSSLLGPEHEVSQSSSSSHQVSATASHAFQNFPKELLGEIASYLPQKDRNSMRRTSHEMREGSYKGDAGHQLVFNDVTALTEFMARAKNYATGYSIALERADLESEESLNQFLTVLPYIRALRLHDVKWSANPAFMKLLCEKGDNLESLDLYRAVVLPANGVSELAKLKKLQHLSLHQTTHSPRKIDIIEEVTQACPQLQSLRIEGADLTPKAIEKLVTMKRLGALYLPLSNISGDAQAIIEAFSKLPSSLRILDLSGLSYMTPADDDLMPVSFAPIVLPNLAELNLDGITLHKKLPLIQALFMGNPHLKKLSFSVGHGLRGATRLEMFVQPRVPSHGMEVLNTLPLMPQLQFFKGSRLPGAVWDVIAPQMPNLKELHLIDSAFNDKKVSQLKYTPQLEVLDIQLDIQSENLLPAIVQQCPNLKSLFYDFKFKDGEGIKSLAALKHLEEITLGSPEVYNQMNPDVTHSTLEKMAEYVPHLRKLHVLVPSKSDEKRDEFLTQFKKLEELTLATDGVYARHLSLFLYNFPSLKTLTFNFQGEQGNHFIESYRKALGELAQDYPNVAFRFALRGKSVTSSELINPKNK